MDKITTYDLSTKTWFAPKENRPDNSFYYKKSLGEHIFEALTKNSDRIAQISDNNGVSLTYSQLLQQSISVAQNLIKIGCTNDDVVVIMMKNGHLALSIVFGCILAGIPINSWHLTVDREDMKSLLQIVEPKLIICDDEYSENIKKSMIEIDHNSILLDSDDKIQKLFQETEEVFKPPPKSEKCGFYVLSSGTTGLYKISTFKESFWIDICQTKLTNHNTIFFTFVNSSWFGGIFFLLFGACNGSTRVITNEPFTSDLMIKIIEKHKVNAILTNPLLILKAISSQKFVGTNFNNLKYIFSSGSILPSSIKKEIVKLLPHVVILNSYGITELGQSIANSILIYEDGAVGPLQAGISVRIVDSENKLLGPNEIGTFNIKIDEFGFNNYYKNEKETKLLFDENGFMKTGDVGFIDDEGLLSVTGREKDLIRNTKGDIHPFRMEELLSKHKDVEEVLIVGVVDKFLDNIPAAAIIKREGSVITEKDILNIIETNDLNNSVNLLGGVYFLNEFPRTSTGKIMRYRVREILNEMYRKRI